MERGGQPLVAVVIPCLNEALTIGTVVADFRRSLPGAMVVVVDNASTDQTAAVAAAAGATVLKERRPGKGNAVRRAFNSIEADVYLLVDGDGTYPASEAPRLVAPVIGGDADVVIGGRLDQASRSEFRRANRMGNQFFLAVVNSIFGAHVSDLLTGYRVMSREFVKRTPILSVGFELETELTILALERGFRTIELPVQLVRRPDGSHSKIRVVGDGLRILSAIITLLRDYRPFTFFGGLGLGACLLGLVPGIFVTWEFLHTGAVRIPTAVLATGLELAGLTSILVGVVLTTLARRFRELDHQLAVVQRGLERVSVATPPADRLEPRP
jgi:glycosyltransferase involved in cell wall biosynthesis